FHFATLLTGTLPAFANSPPTYKSLPDAARAFTEEYEPIPIPPPIPDPRGLQLFPFHFAMSLAGTPPAVVKVPPAYKSPPDTASALTWLFMPEPTALQPPAL